VADVDEGWAKLPAESDFPVPGFSPLPHAYAPELQTSFL